MENSKYLPKYTFKFLKEEHCKSIFSATSILDLQKILKSVIHSQLGCERGILYDSNGAASETASLDESFEPLPLYVKSGKAFLGGKSISLPFFLNETKRARLPAEQVSILNNSGIRSLAIFPVYEEGRLNKLIECSFTTRYHRWRQDDSEFLNEIAGCLKDKSLLNIQEKYYPSTPIETKEVENKQAVEDELVSQRKRIEALFEVARALQTNLDPAVVMLRGLRALIRATNSDCGIGCLLDSSSEKLEIVATEGVSKKYIEGLAPILHTTSLIQYVFQHKSALCIDDVQADSRAAVTLAKQEGLHATIISPLLFEGVALGVIVLFRHNLNSFFQEDLDLVVAASSQIALATQQAELYASEKRRSSSLSSLYRLSHELSKQLTLKEIAEHTFPIIQEEMACKRMWLGVMNERGTHIEGTAGWGPGVRGHVVNLQIELNLRHDFLDDSLEKKEPLVVEAGRKMECSGLNSLMRRLKVGTLVILPLVSVGQVVGVLVVEPSIASPVYAQRKLPLLTSMANEIATVILARRLESRISESDKMRVAGMLASGIAHNFNNLLQAIMGQAALIEMQYSNDSRLTSSARMINEAASKGATLVKQLFSFSRQGTFSPKTLTLKELISDGSELYKSILGSQIQLEFVLPEESVDVLADYALIQQVMTNLFLNSKEAIGARPEGKVTITASRMRLRSGEVDPELAPGLYMRVDIQDNGRGMDIEQQARCFEPFYTTKNVDSRTGLGFEGSGLGLSSAYSIMKQHEGLITVKSEVGKGSTFSLYLPTVVVKSAEKENQSVANLVRLARMDTILYQLEDSNSFSIKATLESLGARVFKAVSLERLKENLSQAHPGLVLVVLDIERIEAQVIEISQQLEERGEQYCLFAMTSEIERWSPLLSSFRVVELVQKPVGVWGIYSMLRKVTSQYERGEQAA